MKKSTIKNLFLGFACLAFVACTTSCNRGYGCPTNFKIEKTGVAITKAMANALLSQK